MNKAKQHVYIVHVKKNEDYYILGVYKDKQAAELHRNNYKLKHIAVGEYVSVTEHTVRGLGVCTKC